MTLRGSGMTPQQVNSQMYSPAVPANSSSTGTAGQFAYDANYLYICIATNTWRRLAVEAF